MGIVSELFHHDFEISVNESVFFDFPCEILRLFGVGKFTEKEQECNLQKGGFFGKLLNWDSPVLENAFVSIDEADFGCAGHCVHISRIVGSQDFAIVCNFLNIT